MANITDDSYLSDYTGGQVDQSVKITSEWVANSNTVPKACIISSSGDGTAKVVIGTTKQMSDAAVGEAIAS